MADGDSGEPEAGGGSAPMCSFVRKPPKNMRKRPAAPAGSDDDGGGGRGALAAARSKKGPPAGKLVFSSADASSEPRRFRYESSRTIQSSDSRATAVLETETEFDRDPRAVREKQLKQAEAFLKKNPSAASASSPPGRCTRGSTPRRTTRLGSGGSTRCRARRPAVRTARSGRRRTFASPSGLTTSTTSARTTRRLGIVATAIPASSCTTEGITSLGGSSRRNMRPKRPASGALRHGWWGWEL